MVLELSQAIHLIPTLMKFIGSKNFETQNFDLIFMWLDRASKFVYNSVRSDEYFYGKVLEKKYPELIDKGSLNK